MHIGMGQNGQIAVGTTAIQTGWTNIWPVPDLIQTGTDGHLLALFGGTRSTDPNETNEGINAATAPQDGSSWSLEAGDAASGQGGNDPIGATDVGGTPFFTWERSGQIYVQRGLQGSTSDSYELQAALGGCCGYTPDIAVGRRGDVWVTWYSSASGKKGIWAQELDPATAAPIGSPSKMPGSTTAFNGTQESVQQITRTPIAAQGGTGPAAEDAFTGGNIYIAYTAGYPAANKLRVWTITPDGPSTDSEVVASVGNNRSILAPAVATDRAGRTWALWAAGDASNMNIYARRSNVGATKWGATVGARFPNPNQLCQAIPEITPEGTLNGAVDVFATVIEGCGPQHALWHTQLEPGLSLSANPSRFKGKEKVTFKVTDAGVPVRGAKVTAGGESATTNSDGIARIVVGPYSSDKRVVAKAVKDGYVRALQALRVQGGN
jgi:hypothetical protein